MNTPAHAVVNLLILGRKERPNTTGPIIAGAILPDLPMIFFYLYEKVWRGIPERVIWSQLYHEAGWLALFDLFHSLPLTVLGFTLAYRFGALRLAALFASMALHALGDLLLHHADAHRHLFPFSDWRFHSPVSYWDHRYFGHIVSPLETVAVIVGGVVLTRRFTSVSARVLVASLIAVYAIYRAYILWMWT
ncbi:MAG: hypothetical protein ACE5JD_11120 [Candidatus Methylomirabilia bacterium]